jgi:hypothetical protein
MIRGMSRRGISVFAVEMAFVICYGDKGQNEAVGKDLLILHRIDEKL